jgi:hypothetical protein
VMVSLCEIKFTFQYNLLENNYIGVCMCVEYVSLCYPLSD